MESIFLYPYLFSRRAKIDFPGKNCQAIGYLLNINVRSSVAQELGKKTLVLGRKVLHEDNRESELPGQRSGKALKGIEAARGRANGDNGKDGSQLFPCFVSRHFDSTFPLNKH